VKINFIKYISICLNLYYAAAMMMTMFTQLAKITDELYISSATAVTVDKLRRAGITFVINCTIEIPLIHVPDIETMKINVDDLPTSRIGVYFDRCADRIHSVKQRGGRTLVHCAAGVSRSASICIAYLMKYHKMNLRDAYAHLKTCRQIIRPNPGFFRQLIDFETRLFGKATVAMVTSPIGFIPDVYREETRNMVMLTTAPTNSRLR
jgi:protein-tyrosine phosphatase